MSESKPTKAEKEAADLKAHEQWEAAEQKAGRLNILPRTPAPDDGKKKADKP